MKYKRYLPFIFVELILFFSISKVKCSKITSLASECEDIGYMPSRIFTTYGKDVEEDLVDIHTFSKYFTF